MEKYKIDYHPLVVKKDIPRLGSAGVTVETSIRKKLTLRPDIYGRRLRGVLKGYWKLRVSDWRVVYEIFNKEVKIFGIIHRSDDYKTIIKRAGLI